MNVVHARNRSIFRNKIQNVRGFLIHTPYIGGSMTTYNLRLKAKNELTPHPTAQYWRKRQVEELFDLPP